MNFIIKFTRTLFFSALFFYMQSNLFGQSNLIPILMYHSVWNESRSIWWVSDKDFQMQMDYLHSYGFHTISMSDYFHYINDSIPLPDKPIILSFDDGFENFYTHVYPELQKYQFKAASALITDFIGSSESTRMINNWDPDSLESSFQTPHLIWPEIREMNSSGLVEFISHSKHHPNLTALEPDSVFAEINKSKRTIEDSLNKFCNTFTYPYGQYTSFTKQLVQDAGYLAATTTNSGYLRTDSVTNLFEMPRIGIFPSTTISRFAEIVDPTYQQPGIQIMFVDIDDSLGNITSHFNIGDTVIVRIKVRNSGPMVTSKVKLKLDTIPNSLQPFYDSHLTNPIQDQVVTFGNGSEAFVNFRWKIPEGAPFGQWYYNIEFWGEHYIIQFDSSGWNKGFSTAPTAKLKVFLQGPFTPGTGTMSLTLNTSRYIPLSQPYSAAPWNYNGTESVESIPAEVTDWVLLELRSNLTTQVSRRAAFLKFDGSIVALDGVSSVDFPGVTPGSYYVVIRHRNHLAVMSATAIPLSSNSALYDFTTAQTQAYGTNPMKDLGGVYGLYAGNGNGDGFISASDKNIIWFPQNGFSGYLKGDFNLNGFVTAGDKNLFWFPNNGLSSQVP